MNNKNTRDKRNQKSKKEKVVKPAGKSIFSMFGKSKKNEDVEISPSITDIRQDSYVSGYEDTQYNNEDMLSFIKDYDNKKSQTNTANIPVQQDAHISQDNNSFLGEQSFLNNLNTNVMSDDSLDVFGNNLSLNSNPDTFGGFGESNVFVGNDETDNEIEESFSISDVSGVNKDSGFSIKSDNVSSEIHHMQDYVDPLSAHIDTDIFKDNSQNDDLNLSDFNIVQDTDSTIEFANTNIENNNIEEVHLEENYSDSNSNLLEEFYADNEPDMDNSNNNIIDFGEPVNLDDYLKEFDSHDDFNDNNDEIENANFSKVEDFFDLDSYSDSENLDENEDFTDQEDNNLGLSKETEEERIKRIREKRKRRKERKKEKIRKYIEEGKKIEEKSSENPSNDSLYDSIENFYSEKNNDNGLDFENLDIQEGRILSSDNNSNEFSDSNIVNLEKMIKEHESKLERLERELEEKTAELESRADSDKDELFESVTKKQIQLLKKELELNSRENELKNIALNVSTKEIAKYKFDSGKFNKSYDVETALKHYETNPKEAIGELKDMAIYSRSNKEYMVAYLALKKLIKDNSEFLELIKEIETAKTKQKLEIERFISTLNVEKNKLL